ncbi:MAG: stage sporulation protein [Bacillota bacterium]
MSNQKLLQGTLVLISAGFITKILGFVYRIALSKLIGDEGMGLFQMAFPVLIFALVITTAGIPVAISKLTSETLARGQNERIRYILWSSSILITALSILVTGTLILLAPLIAKRLLTDERAIYSLIGIAPIIPVIAVSSVFRGYFQGLQQMAPYAISTIIEQCVRIFTVLVLAHYLLPFGIMYAAAGAMLGMVVGELTGLLYLIWSYHRNKKQLTAMQSIVQKQHTSLITIMKKLKNTSKEIIRIALPITTSRTAGSLAYAVEPIVVAQSLALAGMSAATSTALYGQLEGMAIPIIYFPSFITYSLSISLVPAISAAAAKCQTLRIPYLIEQSIRLCLLLGSPCALLLFLLADPLAIALYHNPGVACLLKTMAPYAILVYLQGPLNAILQGLDHAKETMHHSIIGSVVKTGFIFLLASQPSLGINGVALALNAGILITTTLNFISIFKEQPLTISITKGIKIICALALMGVTANWLKLHGPVALVPKLLIITLGSFTVYSIALFLFALITKQDLACLPQLITSFWKKK